MGRESIPPGVYFRMILIGYFEGISSQRGIAWRCHDSRSLAEFLGVPVTEETPDHSSLSRIHGRLPLEVHEAMFVFVLKLAAEKKLLAGKTVAVDSTMLEADAAMKSIVRRDTGEDWKTYLRGLAAEAGLENPTDEELRRFDKNRKDKKVSNDDWQSPNDPDSRIARMKDGTTHAAYKAEHVVDLDTDLVLSAVIYQANRADTETLAESVVQAQSECDCGRKSGEYPRGGGRQGLSRGQATDQGERDVGHSHLRSGTQAADTLEVERSHGGRTSRGDGQSSARGWRAEQETSATTQRADGADVCPRV